MRTLRPIQNRQLRFVAQLIQFRGNGTKAAQAAKYATPQVAAARLIRDDRVLALLVAEYRANTPGARQAVETLLKPHRSLGLRHRLAMVLSDGGPSAEVITLNGRQYVALDPDSAEFRKHVLQWGFRPEPTPDVSALLAARDRSLTADEQKQIRSMIFD